MANKRIILNICVTYLQNITSIIVGFLSVSLIFKALGETQLGVYAIVGSIIGFAGLFNSIMNTSNSRFFAYAIGLSKKHPEKKDVLCEWFNTSISVHICLAFLICLIFYPIGYLLIKYKLDIPQEYFNTAIIVFNISTILMFFTILQIPFFSLFTAKQLIFIRNVIGIFQTLLHLIEALILYYIVKGNLILWHSILSTSIIMLVYIITISIAFIYFPECKIHFKYWYNKTKMKELFSFASFSLFGGLGSMFSGPLTNVIVNGFCGIAYNASLNIAQQLSTKLSTFSSAVLTAVAPEITTKLAEDKLNESIDLAYKSSLYLTTLLITILVPIFFWINPLLELWLGNPPINSNWLSIIIMSAIIILESTSGLSSLLLANGEIKKYQITLGCVNMSVALIAYLCFYLKIPVLPSLAIAYILPRIIISLGRVIFLKQILKVGYKKVFFDIYLPCFTILSASILLSYLLHNLCSNSIYILPVSIIINCISSGLILIYLFPRLSFKPLVMKMAQKILQKKSF